MKTGRNLILLLLLCMAKLVYGEVFLDADRVNLAVGETFNLKVSMEKKMNYEIKNIENFKLLGHYSSSNKSIINGKISSTYTDTYQVISLKEGNFPLKVVAAREESNIMNINVSKEGMIPISEKKFFIQVTPEKENYYFGEKIPYTESLVTTVSLQGIDYLERPGFGDISIVDVNPGKRIGSLQNRTKIGEREALNIVLYQGILEPSSSGSREIGGSVLRLSLEGGDFFSRQFKNLTGERKKVNILPLPSGAPANFKNIVGTLEGSSTLDRSKVAAGEAATLTVELFGSGSLSGLKNILDTRNPDFNIYENIVNEEQWIENDTYQNRKTYQIAFVPKRSGKLKTPELVIPYFNTTEKKYKDFVVESREIEVVPDPSIIQGETPLQTQPTPILDSVEIEVIPDPLPADPYKDWIIIALAILATAEGGVILYLFRHKFRRKNGDDLIKNLRKSRTTEEFYENYCIFMRSRYDFNPKAHSGEKLKDKTLQRIHREIEERRFRGEEIDRKRVVEEILSLHLS